MGLLPDCENFANLGLKLYCEDGEDQVSRCVYDCDCHYNKARQQNNSNWEYKYKYTPTRPRFITFLATLHYKC